MEGLIFYPQKTNFWEWLETDFRTEKFVPTAIVVVINKAAYMSSSLDTQLQHLWI